MLRVFALILCLNCIQCNDSCIDPNEAIRTHVYHKKGTGIMGADSREFVDEYVLYDNDMNWHMMVTQVTPVDNDGSIVIVSGALYCSASRSL